MATFVKKHKQPQKKQPMARLARPDTAASRPELKPHAILYLQQMVGNQAVLRLMQADADTKSGKGVARPRITDSPGVDVARTSHNENADAIAQAARELDDLLRDEGLLDIVKERRPGLGRVTRVPPAIAQEVLEEVVRDGPTGHSKTMGGRQHAHAQSLLERLNEIRARQRALSPLNQNPQYKGGTDPKKPATKGSSGSKTPKVTPPQPKATPKPPPLPKVTGLKPKFAKTLAQLQSGAAKAAKLAGRLSGYVAVWGYLTAALDALDAIETISDLMAHGTAMPKEQEEANKVWRNSDEAKREAEATDEAISAFGLSIFIIEAERSGDDQALLAVSNTLIDLRHSLRATASEFTGLSVELTDQAVEVKTEISRRLNSILNPGAPTTASAGLAILMADALKKIHATITSAADNFIAAAKTLTDLVDELEPFEAGANNAAWDVRQKRAALKK
jgi:hypothetical protein